jgi:hypothetical protein
MGKKKDTTEILAEIKKYIGTDGCVAFEHGFHYPQFKIAGCKWVVTMITDRVAYGYKRYPLTKERRTCNYSLSTLNYSTLNKLMYYMKKYEEYCKKEV